MRRGSARRGGAAGAAKVGPVEGATVGCGEVARSALSATSPASAVSGKGKAGTAATKVKVNSQAMAKLDRSAREVRSQPLARSLINESKPVQSHASKHTRTRIYTLGATAAEILGLLGYTCINWITIGRHPLLLGT